MSCKLISLGLLFYLQAIKHTTPLPTGEGQGVGLCVLSSSYKAYHSPPYGGGAGGGASSYKAYRSPPCGGGAGGGAFT